MKKFFVSLFNFFKKFVTRSGLADFLKENEDIVFDVVFELAKVRSNQGFDHWKDQAFERVRDRIRLKTGKIVPDNWIAIAIHLGYEAFKAKS